MARGLVPVSFVVMMLTVTEASGQIPPNWSPYRQSPVDERPAVPLEQVADVIVVLVPDEAFDLAVPAPYERVVHGSIEHLQKGPMPSTIVHTPHTFISSLEKGVPRKLFLKKFKDRDAYYIIGSFAVPTGKDQQALRELPPPDVSQITPPLPVPQEASPDSYLAVSPWVMAAGGSVNAAWGGIANPTALDWIGLYASGAPDTAFVAWLYVSCSQMPGAAAAQGSCAFTIPSGLPPGTYELRLLANNDYTLLAIGGSVLVLPAGSDRSSW